MSKVWLPNMTMTLVRRASANLPRNNFIFRTTPEVTKPEIREYLAKVYGMNAVRVATVNYEGRMGRSGQHRYKSTPFKKVYVRISDDAPSFPMHPQNPTHKWKRIKAYKKAQKAAAAAAASAEQ